MSNSPQASLHLIKEQILTAINEITLSLQDFHAHPEKVEFLDKVIEGLSQVKGCLDMVEIQGACLLITQAIELAKHIKKDTNDNLDVKVSALSAALMRLPIYLDLIDKGQEDRPMMLLPVINELCDAQGKPHIAKSEVFTPNLASVENFTREETPETANEAEKELLHKLRKIYLVGLLGVMKEKKIEQSLKYLQQALTDLDALSGSKPLGQFWWIARAVVEGLQEKSIKNDVNVKLVLGRVDREIKRFLTIGIHALTQPAPSDVRNKLLYYVAHSSSDGKLTKEVKAAFSLEKQLEAESIQPKNADAILSPSRSVVDTVGIALKEDLQNTKELLDVFTRGNHEDLATLSIVKDNLTKTLDTLTMLGLSTAHRVLTEKIKVLEQMIDKSVPPKESYISEVASSIIFIETAVDNMGELVDNDKQAGDADTGSYEQAVALAHVKQAELAIVKEARTEIMHAQEKLIEYLNENKHDSLKSFSEIIHGVMANIAVLGFERAGNVLKNCLNYVDTELIKSDKKPTTEISEKIADVISSVEYYLECKESGRDFSAMLDKAEGAVANLS